MIWNIFITAPQTVITPPRDTIYRGDSDTDRKYIIVKDKTVHQINTWIDLNDYLACISL